MKSIAVYNPYIGDTGARVERGTQKRKYWFWSASGQLETETQVPYSRRPGEDNAIGSTMPAEIPDFLVVRPDPRVTSRLRSELLPFSTTSLVPESESIASTYEEEIFSVYEDTNKLLIEVAQGYEIQNLSEVAILLTELPSLCTVLLDGRSQIKQIFGDDVDVELDTFVDPEGGSEQELVARILLPEHLHDSAFELLESFDEAWWLDNITAARNKLIFKVEFI